MKVHAPEFTVSEGHGVASAVLETDDGRRRSLWYRVPESAAGSVSRQADPFAIGAVFLAMIRGERLRIAGPVSPSLLGNLEEFIAAWSMLRPADYRRIAIEADTLQEPPASRKAGAVLSFSSGVDACLSAWRHTQDLAGYQRLPLAAGVLIHGFDIPLDQPATFGRAAVGARALLASVGLEYRTIATNFRDLPGEWSDTHGAGLASCLHLLQPEFALGVIGSSYTYAEGVVLYGSCPLTDPLLGSRGFPIVHDATPMSRQEKIQALGAWPEARQHLRVCWQGPHLDRNCGRCFKCLNVILKARVAGLGRLAAFPVEATPARIATIQLRADLTLASAGRTLADARRAGYHDAGIAALRFNVWTTRLRPFWWRSRLRTWRERRRDRQARAAGHPAGSAD